MKIKDFHKPNTPYDISRNADKPELIISCDGKNKHGQYFGYIVMNMSLKNEIEPIGYVNMGLLVDNSTVYVALSSGQCFESEAYRLSCLDTTIKNTDLLNELIQLCSLDFEKHKTYHFFDITFDADVYGNVFAIVDMSKFYTTSYKILPYTSELADEWRDFYDKPTTT